MSTAVASEIPDASHRLEISSPSSPIGSVAIASVPANAIHKRWMTAAVINVPRAPESANQSTEPPTNPRLENEECLGWHGHLARADLERLEND